MRAVTRPRSAALAAGLALLLLAAGPAGAAPWQNPVAIGPGASAPATDARPGMAVAPGGAIHVIWEASGDIRYARSTDGGTTWSVPRAISDDATTTQEAPTLAVDAGGRLYAAWYDRRTTPPQVFLTRSDDGGATWSPNLRVDSGPSTNLRFSPALAARPGVADAVSLLVLRNDGVGDEQPFATSTTDAGQTWSQEQRVGASGTPWYDPVDGRNAALLVRPDGGLIAAWHDVKRIVTTRSTGLLWDPILVPTSSDGTSLPDFGLAGAAQAHAYLVWDWRDPLGADAHHVRFAVSTNGAAAWTSPADIDPRPEPAVAWKLQPTVAADPTDTTGSHAVAAWVDQRSGRPDVVWSATADGGATWSTGTVITTPDTGRSAVFPRLAYDADGNALLLWVDKSLGRLWFARQGTAAGRFDGSSPTPTPLPAPGGGSSTTPITPARLIMVTTVAWGQDHVIRIVAGCDKAATGACSGTVAISGSAVGALAGSAAAKAVAIGRARFASVKPGGRTTVKVRPTATGRRWLQRMRSRRVKLRITIRARDRAGVTRTTKLTRTVRRARGR